MYIEQDELELEFLGVFWGPMSGCRGSSQAILTCRERYSALQKVPFWNSLCVIDDASNSV